MTWFEWLVLAGGLALGYALVSMLMGEQATRKARAAAAKRAAAAPAPADPFAADRGANEARTGDAPAGPAAPAHDPAHPPPGRDR